jgi:butyrate kinase
MNTVRRPRGFAALPPTVRSKYAARGGRARRVAGAPYSITSENAKELAARRWLDAQPLADDVRAELAALVAKTSASAVAMAAGIARSTVTDALGGARVTGSTATALQRALERLSKEAA